MPSLLVAKKRYVEMPKLSAKAVDSILEISGLAQECAAESQFPAVLFPPEICGYVRNVLLKRGQGNNADEVLTTFDNLHGTGRIRVDLLQAAGQPPLVLVIFLAPDAELISESRLSAFGLTPRERDIVHQVCRGLTSLQMAAQLGISVKTVEHHMTHIYKKTQVCNRTELIRQLSF